ncbi:Type I secretion system membrane fusion protein PrsE [Leminorella richardii]|uniref:Membrane fusion protein (MFP) family protein n=1 Tax=Leminorella richardii TaxID=158841 RepID=A0A2X4UYD6_9GAMM|nr:HlyD family type I secretion periplasmic adaptor subunit [Leminorella richardii]SQI40818.1 Type I secretion system membrane fusion protein PrsE [Leminorella richardii]
MTFFKKNNELTDVSDIQSGKNAKIIWIILSTCLLLLVWGYFAELDEVTNGQGTVITWNRSQIIQARDGGVIRELMVREGDLVEANQQLAILDSTRFEAGYNEVGAKVKALAVSIARLTAEIKGEKEQPDFIVFLRSYSSEANDKALNDEELLKEHKVLIDHEMSLLLSRRRSLDENVSGLQRSLKLTNNELALIRPLVAKGAVGQVEELRLRKEENDLKNRITEARNHYFEQAKEELVKKKNELDSIYFQLLQRKDQLASTVITSPVKGIVKDVQVTTVGGVLEPGGKLMEVVPSEDQLVIEVKINPRDIAFIHPNQKAIVKVSAYESSIYGTMDATVERISPDTIQDQVRREQYYYKVFVRTERSALETRDGKLHEIVPGMLATVDIKTGQKSVLDYLLKPLNKAKEALRER